MKLRSSLSSVCAALLALGLTGGVVCLSAHSAHAQKAAGKKRGGAGEMRNPYAEAFKAVGPTPDAQSKFDVLFAAYKADVKTMQTTTTDKKELRKQTAEREMKLRTDADALLTADQVTKFHQGIVAIPIMQHLDRELMLTPEEKAKVEPILDDVATKTDGMKGKEKKAAMDEAKGKIREALTPDQQTKLDAMTNLAGGGAGGARRNAPGGNVTPTTITPVAPAAPAAP